MPEKYKRGAKNFEQYNFTRKSAAEQLAELTEKQNTSVSFETNSEPSSSDNAKQSATKRGRGRPKLSEEEKEKRRQLVAKGIGEVGKKTEKLRSDLVGKSEKEIKEILEAEKEKSEKRAIKNRKSRANGRNFEEEIERGCSFYSENGAALITKVPENRKVVGRTGGRSSMMLCVNDKKSQPDFVGTMSGGKSIVFEAKHTDKGRIEYNRVTDYQREMLQKHYQFGAECFVLVGFTSEIEAGGEKFASSFDFNGETEAVFMIPWNVWENMQKLVGHKFFTLNDGRSSGVLAPYRVRYSVEIDEKGNGTGTVYFLDKFVA